MKRHLELEALAGVAALAQVDPKEATGVLDETRVMPDDWTHPLAKRLVVMMDSRLRSGQALDFVNLREVLAATGTVDADTLYDVLHVGSPTLVSEHLAMVRDRSLRERCVESLRKAVTILRDSELTTAGALSEVQTIVSQWEARGDVAPSMAADVDGLLAELDDVYQGKRLPILPTGIEALDAVIGGLQPTLTMVGGLPGVGKSALVTAIARNLALAGHKVGLVSLEDDRGWLVRRMVSDFSGIGVHSMLTKKLSPAAMAAIGDAAEKAHKVGRLIHIDGRPQQSAPEIVASARFMLSQGCKAIIVDHLGEVRMDYESKTPPDRVVGFALGQLRALANTYKVPVVVMAHFNGDVANEYSEPGNSHFAFSKVIGRMARVSLGLWRVLDESTGERDPNTLRCTVMKQTNGIAGVTVNLRLKAASGVVTTSPASSGASNLYRGDE